MMPLTAALATRIFGPVTVWTRIYRLFRIP
jgi:hypothetical protein